jgi:hypothetical protein
MPSLTLTRQAIADTLAVIDGLHTYATVPDSPAVPSVIVARPRCAYGIGLGRDVDDTWTLELWVLVARIDNPVNEGQLDELITGAGPRSIRERLERSRSIRGDYFGLPDTKLRNLRLTTADARFEAAGLAHLGAVYTLDVICTAVADPLPQEA